MTVELFKECHRISNYNSERIPHVTIGLLVNETATLFQNDQIHNSVKPSI